MEQKLKIKGKLVCRLSQKRRRMGWLHRDKLIERERERPVFSVEQRQMNPSQINPFQGWDVKSA